MIIFFTSRILYVIETFKKGIIMELDFIKCLKQFHRKKLMTSFLFILVVLVIWFIYPFGNVFSPKSISSAVQLEEAEASDKTYVELKEQIFYYTGYDSEGFLFTKGSYYYTFLDDKCVFVLLGSSVNRGTTRVITISTLQVRIITNNHLLEELTGRVAADLNWSAQGLADNSFPFILSQPGYLLQLHTALFLFMCIFSVSMCVSILLQLLYLKLPHLSPCCRSLGKTSRTKARLMHISTELNRALYLYENGFYVTGNYLIEITGHNIHIIPRKDILWLYKHSTFHRLRQSLTYTLCIYTRDGRTIRLSRHQKKGTDAVISYLHEDNPDLIIGYSPEKKTYARQLAKSHKSCHRDEIRSRKSRSD